MPERLIRVCVPASEVDRLVREAEARTGRWFTVEAIAELALWRDLETFGAKRPSMRALAARWSIPLATVHWLIADVLPGTHGGTTDIGESSEHADGHPGAATLADVSSRHLLTIVKDKVGMLAGLAQKVERVRGLDRDEVVSEVYAKCLERQRTRGSFWQPERASLEAWVYTVALGHLRNLVNVTPQPSAAADVEGLGRAAERTPTGWGDRPRNRATARREN
jgi:hypothetical protein